MAYLRFVVLLAAAFNTSGVSAFARRFRRQGFESIAAERWNPAHAAAWAAERPLAVGANFIPSTAVNQLEMWQAATFDEATIRKELGLARGLGMSVVRVFLHDLVFDADSEGLLWRIDRFLALAAGANISTMFVFFDGCWMPDAQVGPQPAPLSGVHNSRWLQSPTRLTLEGGEQWQWPKLRSYVQGILDRFGDDKRVHSWDLYNEPDNIGLESLMGHRFNFTKSTSHDVELRLKLLASAFRWAREMTPTQPIHAGEWGGMGPLFKQLLQNESDIGTFHVYGQARDAEETILAMKKAYLGRPLIMTEYMARREGSTFQSTLPLSRTYKVGALNWGLVRGKTNTIWPWSSWANETESRAEPKLWFHDVFWPSGWAFDPAEAAFIRKMTAAADPPAGGGASWAEDA